MKRIPAYIFAALLALGIALPAFAVSSHTARASAIIAIHSGPGNRYEIIGKLAKNESVHLARCTWHSRWCYVVRDHGVEGWVLGSYLIGSPAKLEVTPSDFMRFRFPFHPF